MADASDSAAKKEETQSAESTGNLFKSADDQKDTSFSTSSSAKTDEWWEEMGYKIESEAREELVKAKETKDEARKLRAALDKVSKDYQQSQSELGTLRKNRREREEQEKQVEKARNENPEDVVISLTSEETKKFNDILDEPKNAGLKLRVISGGVPAMAEFVIAARKNIPPDLTKPVFGRSTERKETKPDSISAVVSSLFETQQKKIKNSVPATETGSASFPTKQEKTEDTKKVFHVDTDYWRAKPKTT